MLIKIEEYASMGPCLFRHGNIGKAHLLNSHHASFNGAVPFQARKCSGKVWMLFLSFPLQWGRAFSGTEMGMKRATLIRILRLQWGRAFSGTEISYNSSNTSLHSWLQWGRAFSGTEIHTLQKSTRLFHICFNGAVPFQARKSKTVRDIINEYEPLQWGRAFSGTEI